ncbi:cellulose binding domain-containing protein [Sphaerimonospora mesophila]|uniref:cellulose binding domain-containing protein n=1 Tax=Sphaerimonospora mesophila TaxID=37483 RepID=UPI0006E20864
MDREVDLAERAEHQQPWNGTQSVSGSSVTVRNAPYNGSIASGGSTTFGYTGNGTATTPTATCTSP